MQGLKVWLSVVVVGLCASQANAQTYIVPTGTIGFPVVAGPIYTPVPMRVRYAPAYQYVTPTAYHVQTVAPVAATEIVPTPAVSTTSTVVSAPVVAPVTTSYVTQTSYYPSTIVTPTVVTPVVPVVRPYPRVRVFPLRGVVRVRY